MSPNGTTRRRIVVAMSGGVDSSVTAALLAEQGHEVIGITLQLYDHGKAVGRKGACCAGQDIADARNVAERIGIPYYVLDYESRFREEVIEDFADSYARGITPIPCVRCNQRIKFRDLLETARDLGADALATGHYARRVMGRNGPELHGGRDEAKDQSYFLFATTRDQLAFCDFPLGDLEKHEVRAHAERLGLPVAAKPESQDICFVPNGHYSSVVEKLRPDAIRPGKIRHVDGRTLGDHAGTLNFTVGQRRGLKVHDGERLYVVGIDAERREVLVGPREATWCHRAELQELNWLGDGEPGPELGRLMVKHRYNEPAVPATLGEDGMSVHFEAPQSGVAPGQACVFYAGKRVLGGGWITSAPSIGLEQASMRASA